MTVRELIHELRKHNPDSRVVARGYEGGVEEVRNCFAVTIALNVNTAWYYGPHEVMQPEDEYPNHQKVPAVSLT